MMHTMGSDFVREQSIVDRVETMRQRGSAKQRLLASYTLANLSTCSFLSSRDLAASCNVDVATVVRFSQKLGFTRFDEFRQSLRAYYLSTLEPADLLLNQQQSMPCDVVAEVVRHDAHTLATLRQALDQAAVRDLACAIADARRVVIAGFGEAGGAALTLNHLLWYMGINAGVELRGGVSLGAQIANLESEDLLLGFSFWRPARDLVQAFHWSRRHHARTAAITDNPTSSIAAGADHLIIVPCEAVSFFQSTSAALSVVHALVALIVADNDERAAAIQRSRSYNREFGVVVSETVSTEGQTGGGFTGRSAQRLDCRVVAAGSREDGDP